MNVLLVNTNVTHCGRSGYGPTPAPAGLISLAGVLRRRRHAVRIAQLHQHVLVQDEDDLPLARAEVAALLEGYEPDLIGISARNLGAARRPFNPFHLAQYYSAFYDARAARAFRAVCRAPIVFGGTAFSIQPGLYMRLAQPDYGLVGEAEDTLPALAESLACGAVASGIGGLIRGAGETNDVACARVESLESIGVGACDALDDFRGEYYLQGGFAPIQTKRGCPMKCIYCTAPRLEGTAYRYRPTAHVIQEMQRYRDTWGVQCFFFADNTFNPPLDHSMEVCDAILTAGLDVEWYAELTPACLSEGLCRLMARSGCIGVTLTPDSCSEAVLRRYGKPFGMAEVRHAIAVLNKHQIPFEVCLIIGGPGETVETFYESIGFCTEYLSDRVVRFYDGMIITERCPAHAIALEEGLIDSSKSYDDAVLGNDFEAVAAYTYFFPHVRQGRRELLELVERACRQRHWLLTSKDYVADPATGEFGLAPEIAVAPGIRPWWRGLVRLTAEA